MAVLCEKLLTMNAEITNVPRNAQTFVRRLIVGMLGTDELLATFLFAFEKVVENNLELPAVHILEEYEACSTGRVA